jgi:sugar porter (SP) family MFS transporter
MMTSTMSLGIAMGLLVAYWVEYGALNISGNSGWRMCFGFQLIPGAAVGLLMLFRPESPRWLFYHGRTEEALQVLAVLHAKGDQDAPVVQSEYEEIRVVVEYERGMPTPSYFSLLFGKQYRRRTALAMGLQFMQQITGVNIILYYAAKVFAQTGRTSANAALLANGIESALFLVASLSLTLMMDYYGRRKPIIIGPFLMGVCMVIVASMMIGFGSPTFDSTTQSVVFNFSDTAAGNTAVAFMFLYMVTFGASIASLPWTYQNEVFPINARSRGTALSTSVNWFVNFWLGLYMPTALNEASWKLYYAFGGINMAISVVTFLFYPETSRRSLEELDLLFTPNRQKFVFLDKEACQKGSLLAHGLESGADAAKELEHALVMGTVTEKDDDLEKNIPQEKEYAD